MDYTVTERPAGLRVRSWVGLSDPLFQGRGAHSDPVLRRKLPAAGAGEEERGEGFREAGALEV